MPHVEDEVQTVNVAGDGLTWRQRKFCHVFAATSDRALAAKEAGYKGADLYCSGSQVLASARVKRYLLAISEAERKETIRGSAQVRDEVHDLIDESIALARKGDPLLGKNGGVVKDPETGKILCRANVPAMLKGAELKGKTIGMYTDVQRLESEMEGKTDEELFALVAAALANHMILEMVAQHPDVVRKVHGNDRRDARAREGEAGDAAPEAELVQPAPEAGRVPRSGLH